MGLLVAGFNFAAVSADEFNDWYDSEHIPERRSVPGFINAERWIGAEDPKVSIATYDLRSLRVLRSARYRAIAHENLSPWSKRVIPRCERICRFECEQRVPGDAAAPSDAEGLLVSALNVDPAVEDEFNEWYVTEHMPALAQAPGCRAARWFRVSSGARGYLALYHLASPDVAASGVWRTAAAEPWIPGHRPHVSAWLRLVLRRYRRGSA